MRNNSEGNVYKVLWKKLSSGYSAWLTRVPKLKVTGKDEEGLSEKLFEVTLDRFGDGEPCFDFQPPLPVKFAKKNYFEPAWFTLGCNEGFRTVGDRSKFYSDGLCPYCGAGRGERTSVPRVIDGVPKSDMAILSGEMRGAYIVSDKFAKFLGRLLGRRMQKVICSSAKKSKKVFYEILLTPDILLEAHKAAEQTHGVACSTCKQKRCGQFVCHEIAKGVWHAVDRQKLVHRKQKVVIASGGSRRKICVNDRIANKIKTESGLKGILLDRLAMLNQDQIGEFKLAKASKVRR